MKIISQESILVLKIMVLLPNQTCIAKIDATIIKNKRSKSKDRLPESILSIKVDVGD